MTAPVCIEDLIVKPYKKLLRYIPRFETYRLTFHSLQDEKKKLDKLSKFDDNLLAAILSFLISTTREESKEKALSLQDIINHLEDITLRRFLGIWLKGYTRYKKLDVKTEIDEGGVIMLETVFEETREEGRIEGENKKSKAIAKKLFGKGYPLEDIAEIIELPVEEIQNLLQTD